MSQETCLFEYTKRPYEDREGLRRTKAMCLYNEPSISIRFQHLLFMRRCFLFCQNKGEPKKMKKLHILFVALLLSFSVLVGCNATNNEKPEENQETTETKEAAYPLTLTDAMGEEVTIEEEPKKVVSLIPSNTEITFALGQGEKVVGVTDFDNYPEEVSSIEKIGGMQFNVEKIISLEPDVVLAHASGAHNSKEGLDQLRNAGITVFVVEDATSFDGVYETIATIGQITGAKEEADKVINEMKAKVEEIKRKASEIKEEDQKTVFIEVDPTLYTAGKGTFMDQMLMMINAKNIIEEEGWPQVSAEAVIEKNPDVIITTYGYYTPDAVEQVLARDGWQDVKAIQTKRVVDVNSDKVTRSGPRLAEGVEELAKAIYPDVFKNE